MPQLQPFWDSAYSVADPGPYVGPLYSSNPTDSAVVGGKQIPGIVASSISVARHLDIKTLPGSSPIVTPLGYEPTRFTLSVRIWTPEQWATIQPIQWLLLPLIARQPAGKTSGKSVQNTFDIFSPFVASLGVSSALCLKISAPTGGQEKTIVFEFLANRRGKSQIFTVKESAVAAPYNAATLSAQAVQPLVGPPTVFTPTQGPQQTPSSSGITLQPTTP